MSLTFPGVSRMTAGRPKTSVRTWIFVVRANRGIDACFAPSSLRAILQRALGGCVPVRGSASGKTRNLRAARFLATHAAVSPPHVVGVGNFRATVKDGIVPNLGLCWLPHLTAPQPPSHLRDLWSGFNKDRLEAFHAEKPSVGADIGRSVAVEPSSFRSV